MLRIALTGTHGTGKSTLIRELASEMRMAGRVNICREAPRLLTDLSSDPEFFRRAYNTPTRQMLIVIEHLLEERRASANTDILLSDRTLVDHLAYTASLFPEMKDTKEFAICKQQSVQSLSYDALFMLPIEFPVLDDGVREADLIFQRQIEVEICDFYREFGITPHAVRGSVEERVASVMKHLSRLGCIPAL